MYRFETWTRELEADCNRMLDEGWAAVKEKVEPRSTPISPSNPEDTSSAKDAIKSTEGVTKSDAESEDHVWGQESCLATAAPSIITAEPAKRTRGNPQDSQARKNAIHASFIINLLGHELNSCIVIDDNAKMAPDRAIDFDALVKARLLQAEKQRVRRHGGLHRSRSIPLEPTKPYQANAKGSGMRTRRPPDQKKRS